MKIQTIQSSQIEKNLIDWSKNNCEWQRTFVHKKTNDKNEEIFGFGIEKQEDHE